MSTLESATAVAQRALVVALELSLPLLAVGLVVGLFFSVFQAVSQVHEQTLSFIPKLFAMGAVAFLLLPWFLTVLTGYAREVLTRLSNVGSG